MEIHKIIKNDMEVENFWIRTLAEQTEKKTSKRKRIINRDQTYTRNLMVMQEIERRERKKSWEKDMESHI